MSSNDKAESPSSKKSASGDIASWLKQTWGEARRTAYRKDIVAKKAAARGEHTPAVMNIRIQPHPYRESIELNCLKGAGFVLNKTLRPED